MELHNEETSKERTQALYLTLSGEVNAGRENQGLWSILGSQAWWRTGDHCQLYLNKVGKKGELVSAVGLKWWFSKCLSWTCSISITWDFFCNTDSWAPPRSTVSDTLAEMPKTLYITSPSDGTDAASSSLEPIGLDLDIMWNPTLGTSCLCSDFTGPPTSS